MPRPVDTGRRAALLDALVDEVAASGIGSRSLRDLAEAVGTSHRMLLHHFGSRDELMIAVVDRMEQRQKEALAELPDDPADAVAAQWEQLRRPDLRPVVRLFFECYARGAQGEAPFDRMHPGSVTGWLDEVRSVAGDEIDPAMARLGLAVARGLLLDLAATDDQDGVDAAAAAWVALLRGHTARSAADS